MKGFFANMQDRLRDACAADGLVLGRVEACDDDTPDWIFADMVMEGYQ